MMNASLSVSWLLSFSLVTFERVALSAKGHLLQLSLLFLQDFTCYAQRNNSLHEQNASTSVDNDLYIAR